METMSYACIPSFIFMFAAVSEEPKANSLGPKASRVAFYVTKTQRKRNAKRKKTAGFELGTSHVEVHYLTACHSTLLK